MYMWENNWISRVGVIVMDSLNEDDLNEEIWEREQMEQEIIEGYSNTKDLKQDMERTRKWVEKNNKKNLVKNK